MIASPVANIFPFDFDCSAQSRKLAESAVYAILGQLGSMRLQSFTYELE